MKVSVIKKNLSEGKVPDKIGIEVDKSIPIGAVSIMVGDIADACVKANDDGMLYCDFVSKKLNTDVNFLVHFANVEFDGENDIEDYDWLWANGVIKLVYDAIDKDYVDMINGLINDEIRQRIALANSVEASVAKGVAILANGIDAVIKNLPTSHQINNLLKNVSSELKGFDPEKLGVLGDLMKEAK